MNKRHTLRALLALGIINAAPIAPGATGVGPASSIAINAPISA